MTKLIKIDKDQLKSDLGKIGLKRGSHIAVTLSFKSIGFVEGGPDVFIDAILDVVGPDGTLMMNTFTRLFPLSEIDPKFVFDPASSFPWTGIVPSTLMKRKNAIRSRHPICSVVAVGKHAKYLTDGHDENAQNEHLPYTRLAQIHGEYLCIGLEDRFVAIRHEAQRRAGLFIIPKFSGVLYKNPKEQIRLYILRNAPCTGTQPRLVPKLVKDGIVKRGQIGMAPSTFAPANALIETMASMLRKDPTLNLCNDLFCTECRELERKLNLYDRIKNPRFFQKNTIARKMIVLRNKLVLKRYNYPSFKNSTERATSLSLLLEFNLPRVVYLITRVLKKKN